MLMQCYSTFYFTFNAFHRTMIMHIMIFWLWYLLWLCHTKLQNEILAWLRPVHILKSANQNITALTTVLISYILHIQKNLCLQENTISKKYFPFFNSFHKKTLSAYFRNIAGLPRPDWKVKVFPLSLCWWSTLRMKQDKRENEIEVQNRVTVGLLPQNPCLLFSNLFSSTGRNMLLINRI